MARQYKLARKMKEIALTAAVKALGVTQPTLSGWESEAENAFYRRTDSHGEVL